MPGKLRSRWDGPYHVTQVLPFGVVELTHPTNGSKFKLRRSSSFNNINIPPKPPSTFFININTAEPPYPPGHHRTSAFFFLSLSHHHRTTIPFITILHLRSPTPFEHTPPNVQTLLPSTSPSTTTSHYQHQEPSTSETTFGHPPSDFSITTLNPPPPSNPPGLRTPENPQPNHRHRPPLHTVLQAKAQATFYLSLFEQLPFSLSPPPWNQHHNTIKPSSTAEFTFPSLSPSSSITTLLCHHHHP
ncbi:hypothetical protein PIB30_089057 [Stylosanthes scabra]|uniref:Reverse transcriptase domain-containing protein n=1 Tax=Stylosanthes scabra TaxID=79078 RepID=A0ABU6WTV1_9FABA|nr:hypothetical protein [Stylosanthes scabra]